MKAYWRPMAVRSISDRWTAGKGAGALALALFCVLGVASMQQAGWLDWLNVGLMGWAGTARDGDIGRHLTPLMRLATAIGDTIGRLAILALVLPALLWLRRRGDALWLALMMAGGTALNLILKQIFAAPRPDLLPHLDIVHSYSFPSGHAAGNMMMFGALAMLARLAVGPAPLQSLHALRIHYIPARPSFALLLQSTGLRDCANLAKITVSRWISEYLGELSPPRARGPRAHQGQGTGPGPSTLTPTQCPIRNGFCDMGYTCIIVFLFMKFWVGNLRGI